MVPITPVRFELQHDEHIRSPILQEVKTRGRGRLKLFITCPSKGCYHKGLHFIKDLVFPEIQCNKVLFIAGMEGKSLHPDIVFLGRLPHEIFQQVLLEMDLVLVPSIWYEAFGRIVLESISLGKTAVLSPMVGIKNELKDHPGIHVIPLSPKAWARFINHFTPRNTHETKATRNALKTYEPVILAHRITREILKILLKEARDAS